MSATADGCQRIIDVVALWCDAVGMLPSSDKTVVMEKTSRQSADGSCCGGRRALRQVSEVRHLGPIFKPSQGSAIIGREALQHWAQAAWAQLPRQYGTLRCEKGVWSMLQLYGACMLPAGSFANKLWGVWLLCGQSRRARAHLSPVHHGHLNSLSGVRRTLPTPISIEELGQQPLADTWLLRAPGFWKSLMTDSAIHKAMAQDVVQLMQVTGTKGWVAGLSKALQTAGYAFQPQQLQDIDIGRLQTLLRDGRERVCDDLDVCPRTAPLQGARNARMNGGSGSHPELLPPH